MTKEKLRFDKQARPCPGCGYDLRAAAMRAEGVRCAECGRVWGVRAVRGSGLPWMQRRWRGRVRSFLLTVWLVVWRPKMLAQELSRPVSAREARRFRMICELLAAPIGTAGLMGAMQLLTPFWRRAADGWWLPPMFRVPSIVPAYLLLEHWYGAVPVLVGIFLATRLCVELYRWTLWLGTGGERWMRQRVLALGHYGAGMILLETLLGAVIWVLIVDAQRIKLMAREGAVTTLVLAVACMALVAVNLWSGVGLALNLPGRKWWRAAAVAVFPVVAYFLWIAVVTAVCWVCGYVVLGVRSMMT